MKSLMLQSWRGWGACVSAVTLFAFAPAALAGDGERDKPGVKPHYVKCDPARPELPCTPDDGPPPGVDIDKPARKGEHPGRKPDYVKCDPAQPHMPCTPDGPPMKR